MHFDHHHHHHHHQQPSHHHYRCMQHYLTQCFCTFSKHQHIFVKTDFGLTCVLNVHVCLKNSDWCLNDFHENLKNISCYLLLSLIISYYLLLSLIISCYFLLSLIISYYLLLSHVISYYLLLSLIISWKKVVQVEPTATRVVVYIWWD